MHDIAGALMALGAALLVCGLLARAGARLGLPTIPLFMGAGILCGPNTAGLALVQHPEDLELLARLGLVFLLFYLGLEFTMDELTAGGRRLLSAAAVYLVLNVGGGLIFGFSLGWGAADALVMAGIVGISSTAIVTKVLLETRRVGSPETRVILGIAVIEDIFLAFYLALLQPALTGAEGPREAVIGIASAFGFLLVLAVLARRGAALVGRLISTPDEEIVIVVFVALALLTAGVAEWIGVSDAIGAFMIGLILGATAKATRLRELTHPLRDAFGAIFFFHFGLTIDPAAVWGVAPQIAIAVVMTVVLATSAGVVAGRMHGFDRVRSANIGFTVLTRGEFSLILAALAVNAGLDPRIGSFTAGYVLLLAVIGPVAAARSDVFSRLIPPGVVAETTVDATPNLELEVGASGLYKLGHEVVQVSIGPGSRLHGVYVSELRLPEGSSPGLLARDGVTRPLEHDTQLRSHDVLLVFTRPEARHHAVSRLRAVHRSGRLAQWAGDRGE